jgi:hypothetical protein
MTGPALLLGILLGALAGVGITVLRLWLVSRFADEPAPSRHLINERET